MPTSFSISSAKRGGAAHSRSSSRGPVGRLLPPGIFRTALLLGSLSIFCMALAQVRPSPGNRAAADKCAAKLKKMEDFAAHRKPGQKQTTQFSQDEVNAYLSVYLKPKYHRSLRDLTAQLEEGNRLQAVAVIDFDRLGSTSGKLLPKLLSFMLSGVHTMTARGQLISGGGKARFALEKASFDDTTLPRILVEEIISAVGKKQRPPFDPLQPSNLFFKIDRVDVHAGYLVVYQ